MESGKQQLKAKLEDKGQGSGKPTGDESRQSAARTSLDRRPLVEDGALKSQPGLTEGVGNQLSPQHNCTSKTGNHLPLQQSAKGHNQLTEGNHEPEVSQGARPQSIQTKNPVGTGGRRSHNANSNTRSLRSTLFTVFLLLWRIFLPDQNLPNLRSHPSTFPLVSGATTWDESRQPGIAAVSPASLPLRNENLKLFTKEVTGNYEGLPLERVRTDGKGDTPVPFTSDQAGPSSILSNTSSNSFDSLVSNSAEGVQVQVSQRTEGICKPDAARKRETLGARPDPTQRPLRPRSSSVSEDLRPQTHVSLGGDGMSVTLVLIEDDFGTNHSLTREQDLRNAVKANSKQGTAESEQPMSELQGKEQLIREKGEEKRWEQEDSKWQEAERPQQKDVSTGSRRLCEHHPRLCRVHFPCCEVFYPCHLCHNRVSNCKKAEARDATHLECSLCQSYQEIDENSDVCRGCGEKMAAYFCSICKHFTSVDRNPYHCDQCGICRIQKDKSFHCKVCDVCLDRRLENDHKCRPNSRHEDCSICLKDTFNGSLLMPCLHRVDPSCASKMYENGIDTCPVCRFPIKEWLKARDERKGHH